MKADNTHAYKTQDPLNDDFDIGQWIYSTERTEDEIFKVYYMSADYLFDSGDKAYNPDYCKLIVATSDTRLHNIHIIKQDHVQETLEFAEWIELNCIRAGEHQWHIEPIKRKYTTQEIFEFWISKRN